MTKREIPDRADAAGFAPVRRSDQAISRRARLMVQAMAALGLVVSIAVAATVVSIGIARANVTAHMSAVLPVA